jgi:electron transport complex protein RnfG
MSMAGPRTAAPDPRGIRSTRLVATLGVVGAIAGLLIVVAYESTLPAIEANREARIAAALEEVLPGMARYETFYLVNGALTSTAPSEHDAHPRRVYAGIDANGATAGYAVGTVVPGFQDPIEMLIGLEPRSRKSLGVAILSSRETPGLGDKIQHREWLAQFADRVLPLVGRKAGGAASDASVDMITGATISSRAVINAVNATVNEWVPVLTQRGGGNQP